MPTAPAASRGSSRGWSRRAVLLAAGSAFVVGAAAGATVSLAWAARSGGFVSFLRRREREAAARVARQVLPADGPDLGIPLGPALARLVQAGVIDPDKLRRLYAQRGGLPAWVERALAGAEDVTVVLGLRRAPYLLNLLWPLGLANRARFNARSPLGGDGAAGLASTAGWTLGRDRGGHGYFNRVAAVPLSASQEAIVESVARASFRPCCDNSAFFQDCNHGSALLGLYELGAAHGMDTAALHSAGLAANASWFPDRYLETAIYFERIEGTPWQAVSPRAVLAARFSSARGWRENVHDPLVRAGVLPGRVEPAGAGCGV